MFRWKQYAQFMKTIQTLICKRSETLNYESNMKLREISETMKNENTNNMRNMKYNNDEKYEKYENMKM